LSRARALCLFAAITAIAAAFRFPDLARRPMHADEAVHADEVGTLLEQRRYTYSTADYHGPTLDYMAFAAARLQGMRRLADLNEVTLRAIPAVFGLLLVAGHYLLIPYIGVPGAAYAALFTAVSPAMVYYSRYFIHETLLECFTFAALLALLAYWRRPDVRWAVAAGVSFGLMYATKETWIIPAACMVAGAAVLQKWRLTWPPLLLGFLAFLAVAALLMSSFLSHPRGVVDSILAYRTYFARGAGENTAHVQPWYFYLQRLLYFNGWSEGLIAALAVVGIVVSKGVGRCLAIYTVLMIAIYCAIPYKVPWNVLGFLHGLILMAGLGTAWLWQRTPHSLVAALAALGVAHLAWQAQAASFRFPADQRNPWVYAHTGEDVFLITGKVAALTAADPAGPAMPLQIITRTNLWPLPWYFRRYPGVRWWNGVPTSAPAAPVILITPDMESALAHKLYELPPPGQREMYVNLFDRYVELRPSVEIRGYIAKSLWDRLP
jgi:uncharacterized protein (TIGR03663 family)